MHPLFRSISLFLIVALVFNGTHPILFAQDPVIQNLEIVEQGATPPDTGKLYTITLKQSADTKKPDFLNVTTGPYNSQAADLSNVILTSTPKSVSLELAGLAFSDTASGDFEGAVLQAGSNSFQSISLGTYGLSLAPGMTLHMGTAALLMAGSSSFVLKGGEFTGSKLAGGEAMDVATLPIRVENVVQNSGIVNLTVSPANGGPTDNPTLATAWLNPGPRVNIIKEDSGDLVLATNAAVKDGSSAAFNGKITINDGNVILGDRFLGVGDTGIAPTVEFNKASAVLTVSGYNTVSSLVSKAQSLTQFVIPTVLAGGGLTDSEGIPIESGTLALRIPTSAQIGALMTDGPLGEQLSIRKQGTGSLKLTNTTNSFTGGLFLEAGSLVLSTMSSNSGTIGAIGKGYFVMYGGTQNTTVKIPSKATNFEEEVQIFLIGTGTQAATAGSVLIVKDDPSNPETTLQLNSVSVLGSLEDLGTPTAVELVHSVHLNISELNVSGTLAKAGPSTLTVGRGTNATTLGTLILREGTLALQDTFFSDATLLMGGKEEGSRRLTISGDTVISDSGATSDRIWSRGVNFSGGDKTLMLRETSGTAAGLTVENSITLSVDSGTFSLGNLLKSTESGTASFNKNGEGTLIFAGTSVSSGALHLNSVGLLAGTVKFSGPPSGEPMELSSSLVTGTDASRPLLEVDPSVSLKVTGPVSGTGFTKTGSGALALNGVNTISGTIILSAGQLSLASGAGAISVGDLRSAGAGQLSLISTGAVAGPISVGTPGATNGVVFASAGTSTATFSGPITLNSADMPLSLEAATGGALEFSGQWNVNNKRITVGGSSSGRTGTVILSSALSTTGGIDVRSGALRVGATNALKGSLVDVNGGALTIGAFDTEAGVVQLVSGAILGNGNGALIAESLYAKSGLISANLAGSAMLTVEGNVTVSGTNTRFTGETKVEAGATLTVGGSQALAKSDVTMRAGGSIAFTVDKATIGRLQADVDVTSPTLSLSNVSSAASPVALTLDSDTDYALNVRLVGQGTFNKAGKGTLALAETPAETVRVGVETGTLTVANLLTGSRSISVAANAKLVNTDVRTGTFSGSLAGLGQTQLVGPNQNLTLGAGGSLRSGLSLGKDFTLNLETGIQNLELESLVFNKGSRMINLGSDTVRINYGDTPIFAGDDGPVRMLDQDSVLLDSFKNLFVGSFVFEENARVINLGDGVWQVTTGRAKIPDEADVKRLQLDPMDGRTISIPNSITASSAIVATGTGFISIENTLALLSGSIKFGQNIRATLMQAGSLKADALDNSGDFVLDLTGDKTVEIPIHGSGSLEKKGLGTATLTGANSYSGATTLTAGILELGNAAAVGVSGRVRFGGGKLRYATGVAVDLSSRIEVVPGTNTGIAIDTGNNTVIYENGLNTPTSALAKSGLGTLVLAGTNAFANATVNAGVLQIGSGGSTGTLDAAARVETDAVLRFSRNDAVSHERKVSGNGTVEQAGTGLLHLRGQLDEFSGNLRLSQGALSSEIDPLFTGKLEFNGGALRYTAAPTNTDLSKSISPVALNQSVKVDTDGQTVKFGSGLQGDGGLEKSGAGTLELLTQNGFKGDTNVSAGLLRARSYLVNTKAINVSGGTFEAVSYNSSAPLTIAVNGTAKLLANGAENSVETAQVFGSINNAGNLSLDGFDVTVQSLSGEGATTFKNDANLPGGILTGSITVGGDLNTPKISGGAVSANGFATLLNDGTLAGVDVSGGRVTVKGADNSSLFGSVTGGTISVLATKLSTFSVLSGGSLDLGAVESRIESLNGGTINNNGTLVVYGGNMTTGVISGSGSLTKMGLGDLSLRAPITYSGITRVSEGRLSVSGAASNAEWKKITVEKDARASFTETSGTAKIGELDGEGNTAFAGPALVTQLTNGSINLESTASLSVSTGTFTGTLTGSGTFNKISSGSTLSLDKAPDVAVRVNVLEGTLESTGLLNGDRSVSVAKGAFLYDSISVATYSGRLTNLGETILTGSGTLTLARNSLIGGSFSIGSGANLDLSLIGNTGSGEGGLELATTLRLLGKDSQLTLGNQQVELQKLVLNYQSKLSALQGQTGTIVYEEIPLVVGADGISKELVDANNNVDPIYRELIAGSLLFEENSKKGSIFAGGTYQFIAGRVKDVPADVKRLLLDPQEGKTVRISAAIPNVTQEVVATGRGTGGFVNVGTLVTTPKFTIGNGIQAAFTQTGQLAPGGVFVNNGTLKFSVLSGSKEVSNLISGTGTLEKTDGGILVLTRENTYTGTTRLSDGILQLNHAAAIGAGTGAIVFNGGTLRYGAGVSNDLSGRIASVAADKNAGIDTGTNNVTFASAISGAGGLSKLGNGTLVLAGEQQFTGVLSVTAGAVKVGAGTVGSLAASAANVSGGALLSFARNDALTYKGVLSGAGRVEQAGRGQLTLAGDGSAFIGTFAMTSGTTVLGASNALSGGTGTVTFDGGTLKYGVGNATDISSRFSALTKTALVDTGVYDIRYDTGLTGTAGLTKYGPGVLTLAGTSNYQGLTTVAAGTLRYTEGGLMSAGTISTLPATRVLLSVAAGTADFNGTVTGSGVLEKDGTGTVNLGNSPANSPVNTGGFNITAGRVNLGTNVRLGRDIALERETILNVANGILDSSASVTLNGTLQVGDGVAFVKSLDIQAGTVELDAAQSKADKDALATVLAEVLSGGSIRTDNLIVETYTRGSVSGKFSGPIKGIPENTALNLEPNQKQRPVSLADPLMKLASLNVSSDANLRVNLRVAEDVTVSGDVTVKGGSLNVAAGLKAATGKVALGETVSTGSGKVTATVAKGGYVVARELSLTGASELTLENPEGLKLVQTIEVGTLGSVSDGTLFITGGSVLAVADQTLKGSGLISGSVKLDSNGLLSPGNSPGTIHFAGSLNLASGTIRIEVGTLAGGSMVQDRININGAAATTTIGAPVFQIVDTDGALATGGTLQSIFVGGNPALNGGTFVFARQSSSGALLPSVMYASNNSLASLQVRRLRFADLAPLAHNIRGFATAVDTRILTQKAATDGLLELGTGVNSTAAVPEQLAAALPSAYTEMAAISTQRTLNLHQGLVGHFSSIRANLRWFPEDAYNVWTTGYGASNRQDGNRGLGTAGFSASTWGDMFGVEQRSGGFLLGVTGAAGRTSANFASTPGSVTTDSWHGGVYSVVSLEPALIESSFLFGGTDSRVRRNILAPGLTSRQSSVNLSGTEWVANVGLALPVVVADKLTLTPSGRFIAQGHSQGAAAESNMSGLEVSMNKQRTLTFQHQVGVELRRKLVFSGLSAAASLQLDWIHNYNARGRNLNMALSGDPNAIFGYRGSNAGADAIHVGGAFEAAINERTSLRLGAEYQSQTALSTIRGSLSIGYQF